MALGISGRALAAALGVSEGAVRKAVGAKRISKLADGTFDLEACRAAWAKETDPARTKVRTSTQGGAQAPARTVPAVETEADARDAVSLIRAVLQEEGADASGEVDFGMARTAETILKARERDLKVAERRKELVPFAAVKRHVEKAFIGYRQQVERLPSRFAAEIAAEVGCEAAALDRALAKAIATVLDELSEPVVRA